MFREQLENTARTLPLVAAERRLFGRRIPGVGEAFGGNSSFADDIVSALEARALWGRYGL